MKRIPFNRAYFSKAGLDYINGAFKDGTPIRGDGPYTKKCTEWFENKLNTKTLLTTSCTHALEMAAILVGISPGDEVIMPSFTFASTADAFVLRGATIVFVDIRRDTLNIDENLIESAITDRTKAIVPVHYAGVSCEMDAILSIADRHGLLVVEDAAQGMMSLYNGKPLGTIGDFGAYSFHETKNYTMGEGGLCLINNSSYRPRSEIIREKGTNRAQFFRGEIDKYSWVDLGSSYLPSDISAAYLYAQLEVVDDINKKRLALWDGYYNRLKHLEDVGAIDRPYIPDSCTHNAHMFYIKVENLQIRTSLLSFLKDKGIDATFHYVPLHSSVAGRKFGRFHGMDKNTTIESERLLRLPMYYDLSFDDVEYIVENIELFFKR